jgi:hypothetical protein
MLFLLIKTNEPGQGLQEVKKILKFDIPSPPDGENGEDRKEGGSFHSRGR